ncbi:MAG: cupin domain-containing protein [Rhodanobacteraceae bacterium]
MTANPDSVRPASIQTAQIVLPCVDLAATVAFFVDRLGFRIDMIMPADAPSTAVVSGHGVALRLQNGVERTAPTLRLTCDPAALPPDKRPLRAPNGVRLEWVDADTPIVLPDACQSFAVSRGGDSAAWNVGRAGMHYRDLIPDRLGGRFVASHIRIPQGGPVPDYVHYHNIRFQMIYCRTGWVRVVYEDQGPPFVMHEGDCVLQPPGIRHRVLESSVGLEVIEIGCPARHETFADHGMTLPTPGMSPQRLFGSQRFVRHVAADATWQPSRLAGLEVRDTGIAEATVGIASVGVLRRTQASTAVEQPTTHIHSGELLFVFVLDGELELTGSQLGHHRLRAGDSCVIPAGVEHALLTSPDIELLEVRLPA